MNFPLQPKSHSITIPKRDIPCGCCRKGCLLGLSAQLSVVKSALSSAKTQQFTGRCESKGTCCNHDDPIRPVLSLRYVFAQVPSGSRARSRPCFWWDSWEPARHLSARPWPGRWAGGLSTWTLGSQAKTGRSVAEIFEQDGEPSFRKIGARRASFNVRGAGYG